MKINKRLLMSALVMSTLLAACDRKPEYVTQVAKPSGEKSEVTVKELEPDSQLFRAMEAFAKGENEQCATDIREAAATMRTIAASSAVTDKTDILNSAADMDSLAARIAERKVNDIESIDAILGKAGRALAQFRLSVTENEFFKHSEGDTGDLLARTIHNLEKSVTLHHRSLNPEEKEVLNDALTLAQQMEHGANVNEDDLKASLQQVNREIEKWNREFASRPMLSSHEPK
ncbi:hypothetical protein WBG78_03440 [Chryseolinea sp. T2]|uniref:hypothetical protein n=1 Tax=Chryseolinea sp. T2 TaxID=3129255 RepID=UPI003078973E